ncbi:GxxExxY protein [Aequorivita marisscotiae]|uniref:GxxExxY protein n=1 Tax=Aequorivita marisscotiae TaxID=3040348 RepID=A0ABY8KPC1_9FLAO|nr:GxxExxY protein [Aequorivita sp. Ant34-E75]WGF91306.1 GxxExxY protein [Aequorivita sp. Ant34-E75]
MNLSENQIAAIVVDCCYHIHIDLGPGLLESVYEEVLFHELKSKGLNIEKQKPLPVVWKDLKLNLGFRTDLIIENKVIIEIKSVEEIHPVHPKQLLTYLKLTGLKLGLLINFNSPLIKSGIIRIVNNL